jgi:hypothetical protein
MEAMTACSVGTSTISLENIKASMAISKFTLEVLVEILRIQEDISVKQIQTLVTLATQDLD